MPVRRNYRVAPRWTRRNKIRPGLVMVLAVVLTLAAQGTASAGWLSQGGYKISTGCCGSVDLGGTRATIRETILAPIDNHCTLMSVLGHSVPADRQIETGVYNCRGTALDGTCPGSLYQFTEIYITGSYTCFQAGQIAANTSHSYDVHFVAGSPTTWRSFIDGVQHHTISGFHTSVDTRAWGEETTAGSSTCTAGWYGDAYFTGWSRYQVNNNSWHFITPNIASASAGCWTLSALSASGGNFHVTN